MNTLEINILLCNLNEQRPYHHRHCRTDDDEEAATDTDCGAANVYEPFMTGFNDMFRPPHKLIYSRYTIHLHILVLSFELFEQSVVIRGCLVLLLVCICYR